MAYASILFIGIIVTMNGIVTVLKSIMPDTVTAPGVSSHSSGKLGQTDNRGSNVNNMVNASSGIAHTLTGIALIIIAHYLPVPMVGGRR